jgi:hypothetical protein
MKALTLTQPWATLVAIGAKRYETRSWSTNYRGPLAIHAAKGFPGSAMEICLEEPFKSALTEGGFQNGFRNLNSIDSTRGHIIATCDLVDVIRITAQNAPTGSEFAFGDYTPGRYMWRLENVVTVETPVPAKGKLSLWEWEGGNV